MDRAAQGHWATQVSDNCHMSDPLGLTRTLHRMSRKHCGQEQLNPLLLLLIRTPRRLNVEIPKPQSWPHSACYSKSFLK